MFKHKALYMAVAAAVGLGIAGSGEAVTFGDPVTLNYTLSDGTTGSVTFDLIDFVDDRAYAEGFTAIDSNGDGVVTSADNNTFDFWLQGRTIGYTNNNAIIVDPNLNTKYTITQVFNAEELVTGISVDAQGAVTANFDIIQVYEYKLYFNDLTNPGTPAPDATVVTGYTNDFVLLSTTTEFQDGSAECPGTSSFVAGTAQQGRGEYSVCFTNFSGTQNAAVASLTVPELMQVDGQLDVPPDIIITQMYDGTLVAIGGSPFEPPGQNVLFNDDSDGEFAVPEPSTLAILGLGLGMLGFRFRSGARQYRA
jgi:hypothetical protein